MKRNYIYKMQKLEPGLCYNVVIDKYGSTEYAGQYIETVDNVNYFTDKYQKKIGFKQESGYTITNCKLSGKLSTDNCYKQRSDNKYLGHFIKTEDYYPDGPWRGGSTTHYFEHQTVSGLYDNIYDFIQVDCNSSSGGCFYNKLVKYQDKLDVV